MKFEPHAYQNYAIDYILTHPAAAIILDMGLGKTAITLSAVEKLLHETHEVKKVLIVAPLRVAKVTWSDEIKKWDHLSGLNFSIAVGSEKERLIALRQKTELTIINRENLPWLIEKSGVPFDYDMVVLDELSSFKDWKSKRFKAFLKVRPQVKRVVGLTGTPSSNGLMDLFAEYKCLDGGRRLGWSIYQYRSAYFLPDRHYGNVVYTYKLRPGAEERIYHQISDITISMKALDHIPMPELVENVVPVRMSAAEQRKYDTMKAEFFLPFKGKGEIAAASAAALSQKLCQMASGAVYTDEKEAVLIHDRKLDALEDILEAAQGPVLLCYWFRHDLERILRRLDERKITYAPINSEENIRRWNEGKLQVGLVHPASAGHGLNLQTGGHIMVFFSIPWSLELYEQVRGRIFRQGQQSKTVVIQHIITTGTIDEQILSAIAHKEKVQDAIVEAVKAELGCRKQEQAADKMKQLEVFDK